VIPRRDAGRLEARLRTHAILGARRYAELEHRMSDTPVGGVSSFLRGVLAG
jgi:hypothetical protein